MIGKDFDFDVAGVKTNFVKGYTDEAADWQSITGAPIPANGLDATYTWLDELSAFDYYDKSGAIKESSSAQHSYTVKNRPFGLNWTVSEREVRADNTGQIMLRARQMGNGAAHFYNDKLAYIMEYASESAGCEGSTLFNGQYFWDGSHPADTGNTHSNLGSSALAQTALETTIYTMRGFTGRTGKRLGVRPTHLVVPPELEFTAKRILLSNQEPATANNAINPMQGRVKLIVLDSLTNATDWYVLDLSKPVRPFFYQEAQPLRVMSQEGSLTGSDEYIKNRSYTFSADGEGAFGCSLWFLGYKHDV